MHNYLKQIIDIKKQKVDLLDINLLKEQLTEIDYKSNILSFNQCFQKQLPVLIAEIKKASPSKGIICENFEFDKIFEIYNNSQIVSAISILTEETFFKGKLEYIELAAQRKKKPLLRKDFIISAAQVYETVKAGADIMLLILSILTEQEYKFFLELANNLGIAVISEIHNLKELELAEKYNAEFIGVNNRNLSTFEVSLTVSEELIKHRKSEAYFISESGITNISEIKKLMKLGYSGFLIGEFFMRSSDIVLALQDLNNN